MGMMKRIREDHKRSSEAKQRDNSRRESREMKQRPVFSDTEMRHLRQLSGRERLRA